MRITVTSDQLKKIRDDAFEAAAKVAEESLGYYATVQNDVVERIRAMKNSPVTIIEHGTFSINKV